MMLQQRWQLSLAGLTGVLILAAALVPGTAENGPVLKAVASVVTNDTAESDGDVSGVVGMQTQHAIDALATGVAELSHPRALATAFGSYFAFKNGHPTDVRKPYLYFVDYGLPNTKPRGYVFDMEKLVVVEGPFTVAAGRGSAPRAGVPTRFSNSSGSAASSLGLYLAQGDYSFIGHTAGRIYRSIGLRLNGMSGRFNSNALARGVVAHGAPYVSANRAGQSEGCPAMEQARAKRLLPKLANGGMVFLFAPKEEWLTSDPWIAAAAE